MSFRHGALAATAALLLTAGGARADVIAGGPVNAANTAPFDTQTGTVTEFQVLYPAADFSGSTNITGVEFFDTYFGGGHYVDPATHTISLLTTSDTSLPSTGSPLIGTSGATTIFSGTPGALTVNNALIINATTDFNYDPSAGNLLLDVTVSNQTDCISNSTACGAFDANSDLPYAYSDGTNTYTYGGGLVTDFLGNAAPVPEPASLALLSVGLFGLLRAKRR